MDFLSTGQGVSCSLQMNFFSEPCFTPSLGVTVRKAPVHASEVLLSAGDGLDTGISHKGSVKAHIQDTYKQIKNKSPTLLLLQSLGTGPKQILAGLEGFSPLFLSASN